MSETHLTPGEITALLIGVGSVIAVIFTGVVNIIVALRRSEAKVDAAITKVAEVSAKADVITGHVNSAATASAAKIDALQQRVDALTSLLRDSKETAAVLAQSKSDSGIVSAAPVEIVSPTVLEVTGLDGGPVRTVGTEDADASETR